MVMIGPIAIEGICDRCGNHCVRGSYSRFCPRCDSARNPSGVSTSPFRESLAGWLALVFILGVAAAVNHACGLAGAIVSVIELLGVASSELWGLVGIPLVLVAMAGVVILGAISFDLLIGVGFAAFVGYVIADEAFEAPIFIQRWLAESGVPVPIATFVDGPLSVAFGVACLVAAVAGVWGLVVGVATLSARQWRKEVRS